MKQAAQFWFERQECKYPLVARLWDSATKCAERYLPVERFDGVHALVNIRTTYLDSANLQSYREYIAESPVRRKLRIRQYGYNGKTNGICWMEIKAKNYGVSIKRRFRSSIDKVSELLEGADIVDHVADMNEGNSKALAIYESARRLIRQQGLRPVLSVSYERLALQDPDDASVRLTIDRYIRFKTFGSDAVPHQGVVLEAKYSEEEPVWMGEFLGGLELEASERFSKYAHGVGRLGLNGVH